MEQQHILKFWRDIEIFNLPDVKKGFKFLSEDELLPWQENRPARAGYTWQHTLLFGYIPKGQVIDCIKTRLNVTDADADYKKPASGHTCLSALVLNEYGCPDENSYVPASYIFGLQGLKEEGGLSTIPFRVKMATEDFERRYELPPAPEAPEEGVQGKRKGPSVDRKTLLKEIKYLSELCDWLTEPIRIMVLSKEIHKDSPPETNFLNSFYLDDLNLLIGDPALLNTSLQQYLQETIDTSARQDLLQEKMHLVDWVHPKRMSPGRWPSPVKYGLYTAQSGAVNSITALKNTSGIQGVNGPPGTGKTTLLKDVVADILVSRAMKMLSFEASDLFGAYNRISREDGYDWHTYTIRPEIVAGTSIVVASNNNNAIENITKALPAATAIDTTEFPTADYFAELGGRLVDADAWGILSAALGNSENRYQFRQDFWKKTKDQPGFEDILWAVYKEEDLTPQYQQRYAQCRSELKSLLAAFDDFQQQAGAFHDSLQSHMQAVADSQMYREKQAAFKSKKQSLETDLNTIISQYEVLAKELAAIQQLITLCDQRKPSFFWWKKLFATATYKLWKSGRDKYVDEQEAIVNNQRSLEKKRNALQSAIEENARLQRDNDAQLKAQVTIIKKYQQQREQLCEQYGFAAANLVDDNFYHATMEDIHLRTPYASPRINKLRSDIFIKSMELHKYAILANAKKFRNNLKVFFELLGGRGIMKEAVARNLWDTFFFCVPVVSTTLASVSRLFSSIGKDGLGWLLLDEAGQATPQSATGILWRSRRAAIVGDPLQVEPVVTIPESLVAKIKQQYNLDDTWSPLCSSAQVLADRISRPGTYIRTGEKAAVWTGFPLRTHRRCDDPMFRIANQIAYNGQMVKVSTDKKEARFIGPSSWFHVKGGAGNSGHVIEEEISLLEEKIKQLQRTEYDQQQPVYVISPFVTVADRCRQVFRHQPAIQIGTIHTFQGREAEIVFLVLGSDPNKAEARKWASRKPNLLNVALTRAQKRIYVIGDKESWEKYPYFNTMAAMLPHT
ncbi:DEAD/DEAH box helicase [Chitinophaga sp. Cy-1792]|uniref:DEAD/DEAH box helicase n=1 Tax=Chitinophaga sp. Cy-1792 TaxID=2608339 RepID=UPI00141F0913|nr:AAA domain-containing protein [Chitinophaga sp. Cy-1792]NIG55883.1 hypothetical protein [Chitinophaga sp. Cy-1792]